MAIGPDRARRCPAQGRRSPPPHHHQARPTPSSLKPAGLTARGEPSETASIRLPVGIPRWACRSGELPRSSRFPGRVNVLLSPVGTQQCSVIAVRRPARSCGKTNADPVVRVRRGAVVAGQGKRRGARVAGPKRGPPLVAVMIGMNSGPAPSWLVLSRPGTGGGCGWPRPAPVRCLPGPGAPWGHGGGERWRPGPGRLGGTRGGASPVWPGRAGWPGGVPGGGGSESRLTGAAPGGLRQVAGPAVLTGWGASDGVGTPGRGGARAGRNPGHVTRRGQQARTGDRWPCCGGFAGVRLCCAEWSAPPAGEPAWWSGWADLLGVLAGDRHLAGLGRLVHGDGQG